MNQHTLYTLCVGASVAFAISAAFRREWTWAAVYAVAVVAFVLAARRGGAA